MKNLKRVIAAALLLLFAVFLLWTAFIKPSAVLYDWKISNDGKYYSSTSVPHYSYHTSIPHLYFKGEVVVPEGFPGYVLQSSVDGCFENITVNSVVAYQNTACSENMPHDEQAVDASSYVHSGSNLVEITILFNGGTTRFEVYEYRKFNFLRFALAVVFITLALFLLELDRRYVYSCLLVSLVLLHTGGSLFPVRWGFDMLEAFPWKVEFILALVAVLVALPLSHDFLLGVIAYPASRLRLKQRVTALGRELRHSVGRLLAAGDVAALKAYVTYAVMFIASFVIFWVFRTMHSSGDAGSVGAMPLNTGNLFFPTSPLAAWSLSFAFRFLRNIGFELTTYDSSALVSCFAGAASVPALWVICREVFDSTRRSVILFSLVISAYFMELFFGYIEFYPMLLFTIVYYLLAGVYYLKGKVSIVYPSLAFAVMFCTHLSSGFLGPSLLVLYACRVFQGKEKAISGFVKMSFSVAVVLLLFFGHVILINQECVRGFMTCIQQYSVSLKGADASFFRPDFFTMTFLQELLNEYILVAPGAFALLFFVVLYYRRHVRVGDSFILFFAAATVGFFIFTAVHMTGLGLPRDWDVLAAVGLPLMLFSGYVFITAVSDNRLLEYCVFSLVFVVLLIHTIPAVLDDADKEYVLANPIQAASEAASAFRGLLDGAQRMLFSVVSPLKLVDSLDVGDVISEGGHSYSIDGAVGNGSLSSKYADGAVVRDTYRRFTNSESFIASSVPDRKLIIVKRVLCPSEQVTRVYLHGILLGRLRADCNGSKGFWKDVNVTAPADIIHGDLVGLMFVSDNNQEVDSYRYWIYAEK